MESSQFVNIGSFRPNWIKAKERRCLLTFSFSLEVPEGEESAAVDEMRESILESLTTWSRDCGVRSRRREKERREKRGL
jgi:hypothetical protein